MATFSNAMEAVKLHGLTLLLNSPDIRAVGVGVKTEAAIQAAKGDDFCLTAVVSAKRDDRTLETAGIRPFAEVYGREAEEAGTGSVGTNVIESGGDFITQSLEVPRIQRGTYGGRRPVLDTQKFFTSLRCGIGITNPQGQYPGILSVGTLGAFLRDDQGVDYLLSNNHVIAHSNAASPSDPVVQTGTLDLTEIELSLMQTLPELVTALKIAELAAFVQINVASPNNVPLNRVDAAIAKLTAPNRSLDDSDRLCYGGRIMGEAGPIAADADGNPLVPNRVYKVGRTTGFTEGEIDLVGVVGSVDYPTGTAYFQDLILIRATGDNGGPFSDRGDSGSLILTDRHEALALLFAGSPQSTLACPIGTVLTELGTELGRTLELVTA